MPYLTFNAGRRSPWVEHANYPTKAIANWVNGDMHFARNRAEYWVYEMSEDRRTITLILHLGRE